MPTFSGSITTTGKSEAIRLDKALFRLHPEFRQKAKVRAQIISPGHALISVVGEEQDSAEEADPVVSAFLAFLEEDMKKHPGRRTRLTPKQLNRAIRLTKKIQVDDDEIIPLDVTV